MGIKGHILGGFPRMTLIPQSDWTQRLESLVGPDERSTATESDDWVIVAVDNPGTLRMAVPRRAPFAIGRRADGCVAGLMLARRASPCL